MAYLRIIKYPGAKTTLIPDIREVFRRSGLHTFIDVFGGSGIVLLNLRAENRFYNDLDQDLVNLFRTIQEKPSWMYERLKKSVSTGRLLYQPESAGKNSDRSRDNKSRGRYSRSGTSSLPVNTDDLASEERAFYTLFRFTVSFGGMGDAYKTEEKSTHRYAMKTLGQFDAIRRNVSAWSIDNLDFRKLISKYDSEDAFFYIDPPYYNKKWYNHNFSDRDYLELKSIMKSMKGKYLMNIDADDEDLEEIFGEPDFIKGYENQNQNVALGTKPPRLKAFYTNV